MFVDLHLDKAFVSLGSESDGEGMTLSHRVVPLHEEEGNVNSFNYQVIYSNGLKGGGRTLILSISGQGQGQLLVNSWLCLRQSQARVRVNYWLTPGYVTSREDPETGWTSGPPLHCTIHPPTRFELKTAHCQLRLGKG